MNSMYKAANCSLKIDDKVYVNTDLQTYIDTKIKNNLRTTFHFRACI